MLRAFHVIYYGEQPDTRPEYGADALEWVMWRGGDTVFFEGRMSCIQVKKSLINHDGYPSAIYVKRQRLPR